MSNITKAMIGVTALGAALFVLSGVFSDDDHGIKWILGGVGWFGFLLCLVLLIMLALVALGRTVYRRTTTTV